MCCFGRVSFSVVSLIQKQIQGCEHEYLFHTSQIIWLDHNATLFTLNMQEKQRFASNFHVIGACPKVFPSSSRASSPQPITWPTWGFLPVLLCMPRHYAYRRPHSLHSHMLLWALLRALLPFPSPPALRGHSWMWCMLFLSMQTSYFSFFHFWGLFHIYLLTPTFCFWWPCSPAPCSLSLQLVSTQTSFTQSLQHFLYLSKFHPLLDCQTLTDT